MILLKRVHKHYKLTTAPTASTIHHSENDPDRMFNHDNDDNDDKYHCNNNININSSNEKGGLAANEKKKPIIIITLAVA